MSHYRVKTKYETEGAYGSVEVRTLYAHHNLSCDYVTFYDDDGSVIFSFPDTIKNNIFDAMKRLEHIHKSGTQELNEGIEYLNEEDRKKLEL